MTDRPSGTTGSQRADDTAWPPNFPHAGIDALLERIERLHEADADTVVELLLLIAREAQRLRTTVLRLSTERLSAAEREARAILEEAHRHAWDLRALALSTLDDRLDEADRLLAAVRETVRVEREAGALGAAGPGHQRRPEP